MRQTFQVLRIRSSYLYRQLLGIAYREPILILWQERVREALTESAWKWEHPSQTNIDCLSHMKCFMTAYFCCILYNLCESFWNCKRNSWHDIMSYRIPAPAMNNIGFSSYQYNMDTLTQMWIHDFKTVWAPLAYMWIRVKFGKPQTKMKCQFNNKQTI